MINHGDDRLHCTSGKPFRYSKKACQSRETAWLISYEYAGVDETGPEANTEECRVLLESFYLSLTPTTFTCLVSLALCNM